MAVIYMDLELQNGARDSHPAMVLDTESPLYKMARSAIDKKSVFHFNREEAYKIYKWYVDSWHTISLVDEFGERISEYTFKDILKKSYYMVPEGKKMVPSNETIEEMVAAVEMEKKILENMGNEEKAEEA